MHLTKLRERITLQTKSYVADRLGGYKWTWADGPQLWAEVKPHGGPKEELSEIEEFHAPRYVVKWRAGIKVSMRTRFLWRGQVLKLLSMPQEDTQHRWVSVITQLEVPYE